MRSNSRRSSSSLPRLRHSNTSFFHLKASSRRRINVITSIVHQGYTVSTPIEISSLFTDHYRHIFGTTRYPPLSVDWHSLYPHTVGLLGNIESPFTEEEIKKVVFGLAAEKAPGPHGYPMLFFNISGNQSKRTF